MLLLLLLLLLRQRRRGRLISDVDLGRRQDPPDAVDELQGVGLGPEVDVERVKLVVVFVLVMGVVGREVPLVLVDDGLVVAEVAVDDDVHEALMPVRICHAGVVQN